MVGYGVVRLCWHWQVLSACGRWWWRRYSVAFRSALLQRCQFTHLAQWQASNLLASTHGLPTLLAVHQAGGRGLQHSFTAPRHVQGRTRAGDYPILSTAVEGETYDRHSLLLPGTQLDLVQAGRDGAGRAGGREEGSAALQGGKQQQLWTAFFIVAYCAQCDAVIVAACAASSFALKIGGLLPPQAAAKRTSATIVVVLVHGGPLDVEWLHLSPRVGAVMSAWFPGQVCKGLALRGWGKRDMRPPPSHAPG